MWNSSISGNYSGVEAIARRSLSANEKSMVIGFIFQDPATVGPGAKPAGV
jgi:hypothetical protein